MATIVTDIFCDLTRPVKVQYLHGNLFSQDNAANTINVHVHSAGVPESLGGTISANVIRSDGGTVAVVGSVSGDTATVVLPQACYAVPGVIHIIIKSTVSSVVTTIAAVVANVYASSTDTVVDPGTIIPSVAALIAQIETAVDSIPVDYSGLLATIASDYSSSKTYQVGQYVWQGGVLKRCIVPITTAETYTAAHWTNAVLGDDVTALKSAFDDKTDDIVRKMEYVRSENLCRGDDTMTSGYMGTDGTVYSSASFAYTEKIPVNEGEGIRVYNKQSGTFAQRILRFVTAFDSSGNVVSASGQGGDGTWLYTVPSGIAYIIISIAVGTEYMVSVGSVRTQYVAYNGHYKATMDFLGNTIDGKVDKNGTKQVTSNNIADLVKTDKHTQSFNIFGEAESLGTGKYVDIGALSGKLVLRDNANLDSYILPVDGTTYKFTSARFALLLESDRETPVGSVLQNVTSINTTGASYVAFTINPSDYPASSYVVTKTLDVYKVANWEINAGAKKEAKSSVTGAIASGGSLILNGRSAIKDGELIVFKGYLTSIGNGFKMNFYGSSVTNYIEVTATQISVKYNTSAAVAVNHNLDFSTAHEVTLTVQFKEEDAIIKLYADGSVYSVTYDWYQTGGTVTEPRIVSNGAVFSDATLIVTYEASNRGIWYFGDSYISLSAERWPYYLNDDGYYKNALLNGAPGGTSGGAMIAFNALLNIGTPQIAVFATGMNDGSDTNGEPPTAWKNNRDTFISLCEENGITPIFCTIPTVPSVNNESKNAWVKASGYRYIDFAKAVGANSSGVWYSGMLSGDNVHPTATGAKALYTQVLIDLPEVTIH